jgi:hypothetical protein
MISPEKFRGLRPLVNERVGSGVVSSPNEILARLISAENNMNI